MPQWGPFFAVAVALTVLLLFLARQSQRLVHERTANPGPGTDADSASPDGDVTSVGPSEAVTSGADRAESIADTGEADGSDASVGGPESVTESSAIGAADETGDATPERPVGTGSDGRQTRVADADSSDGMPELTSTVMLANVASTQGIVLALVAVAAWYFSIPAPAFGLTGGPLVTGLPGVVVGVAFGLVLWLANEFVATVADAAGATYDETVRELLAPKTPRGWVGLFGVALPLIAIAEEVLFRAALIGVPAAGFDVSPWLLVAGSSAAFALGHGAQGRVGIVVTGGLGLALAAGFVLAESLLVVVVAHYVVNATEFLVHEFIGVTDLVSLATLPTLRG